MSSSLSQIADREPPTSGRRLSSQKSDSFRVTGTKGSSFNLNDVQRMDPYAAAKAFVAGEFDVHGDLVAAVRFFEQHWRPNFLGLWHSIAARLGRTGSERHRPTRQREDIQFHYDRSNEFYAQFLDSRMQYSSGDFGDPTRSPDPNRSLDEAQRLKLEQVCRSLNLQPGERLLDIGCGWGGLVVYAAQNFGVTASGCTLSAAQREFALDSIWSLGLQDRIQVLLQDYRQVSGRFGKIASVGMFEHAGLKHLPEYFERACGLLESGGLFLNRGIVRPEPVTDGPETLFLQRNVFPGGELPHLSELVKDAESAGFEIIGMFSFRTDYGLTCQAWVRRLQEKKEACEALVGAETYRTWLLYLAASAVSFESGTTDAVQLVMRKSPRGG